MSGDNYGIGPIDLQNVIGKISYVEKFQDVQDRSADNKVVVVIQEFKDKSDNKMEEVEETKRSEMIVIEKEKEREKRKKKDGNTTTKDNKLSKAPEEEEGKIIDIKG